MQGIQSLMPGQAQQAPMPGMMPKPGAATPPAVVAGLERLPSQQVLQMYSQKPSLQILAALDKAYKREELGQSMRGQQAMQAAQPGTVADQVVSQISNRGIAQFSGGGAVAFGGGGAVQHFTKGSDENGVQSSPATRWLSGLMGTVKEAFTRDPEAEQLRQKIRNQFAFAGAPAGVFKQQTDEERQRAKEIMRLLPTLDKEQMRNILGQTQRTVDPAAYQEFGPGERMEQMTPPVSVPSGTGMATERPRAAPPSATAFDITNPASINALRMAAQDTSLPESERADLQRRIAMMQPAQSAQLGVASLVKPQATLTPEEEASYANRASTLRTRQGLPEDVLAGRQGITTLAAENLAAQRAEREQLALEAKEQRDASLARSQRDIFDNPMDLLALAGSIDTRKGQVAGSLSRGAAGLMGKREEQAEAARKEFALAQRDQRMLQANERQANMLEMQRQQAIRENDFTRVSQIEDQLAALEVQKSQLLRSRQEHAEKMALEGRKVDAMEAEAVAKLGRPTEIDFFRQDPEGYGRFQAARRGPQTAGERQDLAELKTLQGNLQKQVENYMIPKPQRDAAAVQLEQVNAKLAQMAGLDGAPAPAGGAAPAVGTIMQGYRFKGGNPADKNNWEKV